MGQTPGHRGMCRTSRVLLTGAIVSVCCSAAAQDPSRDKARAAAAFAEGKSLMAEGNYSDACPRFRASDALDPEVGTKMNLAFCYEGIGATSSAYSAWRRAANAAAEKARLETNEVDRKKQLDREAYARDRMAALAGHLVYVTVRVREGVGSEVTILLDGERLPEDLWEVKTPVDPGVHQLVRLEPLHDPWWGHFEVDEEKSPWVIVEVPELRPRVAPERSPTPSKTTEVDPNRGVAIGLAAAALATGVVGVGFGVDSLSTYSHALSDCTPQFNCNANGIRELSRVKTDATIADASLVVAGAEAVSAVVVWWIGAHGTRLGRLVPGFNGRTASLRIEGNW